MKNFVHENKTEHRETASAGLPTHNGTAYPISFYNKARSTQCDATKKLRAPSDHKMTYDKRFKEK